MAKKNWMTKLQEMEGAVTGNYDRFSNVIETPSPSVNFAFGKGFGLPRGYSLMLYGPPKGGKTLITNATIGNLHRTDPDAIVVKFDTEMREEGQMREEDAAIWGIDRDRYICFSGNTPGKIYNRISNELAAMCQDGAPIALIVIDSLNGIMGRRAEEAADVEKFQIGDEAMTNQIGLKQILPVQRKHNIGLIITGHVRAEMDQLEVKRGNKVRMAAAFGVQHHCEYFMYVERNRNKDAKADVLGNVFENKEAQDIAGNADVTAHKIRAVMKANSMGPAGRFAEFTLDYKRGIVNQHEEVFLLGINRGIIERPNNRTYVFGGKQWDSKEAMLTAIKEYPELQQDILKELRKRDAEGKLVEPETPEESA